MLGGPQPAYDHAGKPLHALGGHERRWYVRSQHLSANIPTPTIARDRFRASRVPPALPPRRTRCVFARPSLPTHAYPPYPQVSSFGAFREHTSRARAARADPAGARQRHRSAPPASARAGRGPHHRLAPSRRRGRLGSARYSRWRALRRRGRDRAEQRRGCSRGVRQRRRRGCQAPRAGVDTRGSAQHRRRRRERRGGPARDDLHHHRGQPGEDLGLGGLPQARGRGRLLRVRGGEGGRAGGG